VGSLTTATIKEAALFGKALAEMAKVEIVSDPGSCWIWQGKQNRNGYGVVRVGQKYFMVHRLLYQQHVSFDIEEKVLDHKCRNRLCCNPWHLEPVSVRENTLRGEGPTAQNARKTHCPRNHEYSPENTKIRKCGRRQCLACTSRKKSNTR